MNTTSPARRPRARKKPVRELMPVFINAIGYTREPEPETRRIYHDVIIAAGQRPGTLRWRAAVHVITNAPAKLPPEDFDEQMQQFMQRTIERRTRTLAAADANAEAARRFVDDVWTRTGAGPTWAELARACGVPGTRAEWFVSRLHDNGVLTSTEESRSLRVKPSAN